MTATGAIPAMRDCYSDQAVLDALRVYPQRRTFTFVTERKLIAQNPVDVVMLRGIVLVLGEYDQPDLLIPDGAHGFVDGDNGSRYVYVRFPVYRSVRVSVLRSRLIYSSDVH